MATTKAIDLTSEDKAAGGGISWGPQKLSFIATCGTVWNGRVGTQGRHTPNKKSSGIQFSTPRFDNLSIEQPP